MAEKGVTYWRLDPKVHGYSGDVTKNNCGLTGQELDFNFHFLRGADIAKGVWDNVAKKIVLTKVNGEKISFDIGEYPISIETSGTTYYPEEGKLVLCINGTTTEIEGFVTQADMDSLINRVEKIEEDYSCDIPALKDAVKEHGEEIGGLLNRVKTAEDDINELYKRTAGGGGGSEGGKVEDVRVDGVSYLSKRGIAELGEPIRNIADRKVRDYWEEKHKPYVDGKVNEEANARKKADASLQSDINKANSAITQEVKDRNTAIKNAVTGVQGEISAEKSARTAADKNLQSSIDKANSAITQEIKDRERTINSEKEARENADATLAEDISNEAKTRERADEELSEAIKTAGKVKDVKVDGKSVLDKDGVANITLSDITLEIINDDKTLDITKDIDKKTHINFKGIQNPEILL